MARSRTTADAAVALAAQVGYLSGLTLSRASATTFGIATGGARNEDAGAARFMALGTAITKSLSAWAVGTGNGGIDTGTVANTTWYHVHLIRRDSDGVVDALYSLSATAPTMPSGWTARRRLGAFRTDGSAQILAFKQTGDVFAWDVPLLDVNATNPGTAAVTRALTVPTNVVVFPVVAWAVSNATTAAVQGLISDLAQTDNTPGTLFQLNTGAVNARASALIRDVPTNTSAQVRTRLSASGASDILLGTTLGWIDMRGR
jgi:hypothetical protein